MRFTGIKDLQYFITANINVNSDKVVLAMERMRNEIKAGMPHISILNAVFTGKHIFFYNNEKLLEYTINIEDLL